MSFSIERDFFSIIDKNMQPYYTSFLPSRLNFDFLKPFFSQEIIPCSNDLCFNPREHPLLLRLFTKFSEMGEKVFLEANPLRPRIFVQHNDKIKSLLCHMVESEEYPQEAGMTFLAGYESSENGTLTSLAPYNLPNIRCLTESGKLKSLFVLRGTESFELYSQGLKETHKVRQLYEIRQVSNSLFDWFFNHPTSYEEVSWWDVYSSKIKVGVGAAATLYAGYKTFKEISNLWSNRTKAQGIAKEKQLEEVSRCKKRAWIYGITTVALGAFTALTYISKGPLDDPLVYETTTGYVRFIA
jgi:hypothetical protein